MQGRVFTPGFIILSLAALGALVILLTLGSWQVQRLQWKEALIERVETRIASDPVDVSSLGDDVEGLRGGENDLEYRPLNVSGAFDHTHEFHYYATLDGAPGYHIYSPLSLSEPKGKIALVNRGFIPVDKKDVSTRPESLTKGTVAFTGLFRWPDDKKPNSFTPDNDVESNILFWRDRDLMISEAGLEEANVLPFFIYVDKADNPSLPIGGVSIISFANNHLQYAITWFGLALTLIGVYGGLLISRMRAR